jgi:hypothetical protein
MKMARCSSGKSPDHVCIFSVSSSVFFFFNMLLSVCFPGKSFIFERNALSCVIRTIRLRMEYSIGCFVLSIFLSFDVHLFLFLLYLLFSWNF